MKQHRRPILTESFVYIAQKVIHPSGTVFRYADPYDFWLYDFWFHVLHTKHSDPVEGLTMHLFYSWMVCFYSTQPVGLFSLLKKTDENAFVPLENKQHVAALFGRVQRVYRAFSRIAFLYKHKKARIQIDTDLFLNPIQSTDPRVMIVYQDNRKYLFTMVDLIKIIQNAICHHHHFFSTPIPCKNPYNQLIFNKSTLYNIYFGIRQTHYIMPTILQQYFLCDFDLRRFQQENDSLIREYNIQEYIHMLSEDDLVEYIHAMISIYNRYNRYNRAYANRIQVHPGFPREKYIAIFKPYLPLYFGYRYSNSAVKKRIHRRNMLHKLYQFAKYNPSFGKKTYRIQTEFFNRKRMALSYNDTYIEYHLTDNVANTTERFMRSHAEWVEEDPDPSEIQAPLYFDVIMDARDEEVEEDPEEGEEDDPEEGEEDDPEEEEENA